MQDESQQRKKGKRNPKLRASNPLIPQSHKI